MNANINLNPLSVINLLVKLPTNLPAAPLTAFALVALAVLPVPPVHAQAGSEAVMPIMLEEIVVTARRRAESLQSAPVTITAFNARAIEEADIERMEDLFQLTPNVSLATSQGIGTNFLTIRGLTQTRNGESPVATIIDGVLQFNNRQFRQELFDVESIEVAKGPQGAIYGRNAAGGAVIIRTKRPSNEPAGYIQGGVGNGDEYSIQAALSGPVIPDQLYGRLALNYIDRKGYLDNLTTGDKDDPFRDLTLRGRLIWDLTKDFSADLRVNIARHDGRGIGFQYQGVEIGPDGITGTGFGSSASSTAPVDADNVVAIRANNLDEGNRDTEDVALKLDWQTAVGALTSTSSYTRLEEFGSTDQFPYTNARSSAALFNFDGTQTQYVDIEGFSQELRLTSPEEHRLRWNAGVYYLAWDRFISSTTGTDTGAGIIRIERAPSVDAANPTTSFLADDNDNTAWAIFGQVNYDLTEQLELSFALRYDKETREQRVSPQHNSGVAGVGDPGALNKKSFDAWQPKATLRYTPSDDLTLFATWGRGFRSGQFNQNGVAGVAANNKVGGVSDVAKQEDSESSEAGFKSAWLERRLRINGAIFKTDVEGQHYFIFLGGVGAQVLLNIDEVSLLGAELEAVFNVAEGLDVYAAYGITSSEIDKYAVDPKAVGNWAPYIPQSTFNIGGQYRLPLPFGDSALLARIDFERRGKQFWDPQNSTARSALEFLNVRFGIQDNSDKWSLMASIDNATNVRYNSEWVWSPGGTGGFSAAAPGRIWGVDFRYRFF